MTEWLPPSDRPPNEAAGYLGYYARVHLPVVFDLVDCDGGWPALWIYYQARGRTFRLIEEKPFGQKIHPSQRRPYGALGAFVCAGIERGAYSQQSGIFVLHDAEKLVEPEFPVRLERLMPRKFAPRPIGRDALNDWLLLEANERKEAA